MGHYMPCRSSADEDAHLYRAGEPDRALCGRSVSEPTPTPGDRAICVDCAKQLLAGIFRRARRISSLEVVAHDED